jgi:integrase
VAHIRRVGQAGAYRYQVRWVDPDRREHSKTHRLKIDAERHLTSLAHSMLAGTYVDPAAGRLTFYEYAEAWRVTQRHRESTRRNVKSKLAVHVYPVIGHMQLSAIRSGDLRTLRASFTIADSTAGVVMGLVGSVLKAAVEDRIIAAAPPIRGRAVKSTKIVPMTPAQVREQADAIADRYRAFVILEAMSGLRPGEMCGLSVDRFRALRREVKVDRQLTYQASGGGHVFGPPKTPAGHRTVPIPQEAVDVVAAHLAKYGPIEHLGEMLIFSNERGRPIQPTVFARGPWSTAAARSGLPDSFTPHDVRHFYASALIAHGESVTTVQHRLGHESALTTLRTYSHLWGDSDDRTRTAIEAAFAPLEGLSIHTRHVHREGRS